MPTATKELQDAKAWLAKETIHDRWDYATLVRHLERFAEMLTRTSRDQRRAMMSEFHNCAGRLPYFQDRDIGALILEATADAITDTGLRLFLYTEARLRATWCAQGATAGGEGTARDRHIQELDDKIRNVA